MRKFYTAEAVTEGHPDKLCDQIADAILDVCLKQDERSRVACEVLATKGTIIVAGEITSTYEPDVFAVVRKVLFDIGYSSEEIKMDTFVHQQSPDIAGAVDTSKERREGVSDNQIDWFQGAGDAVYRMLERMEKKTGIHTTPHMLRRYFGNMRRDAGWPLEMISEAYGHKHTDTTIKYLNIVDDQLMEASDQYYAKHSVLYDVEKLL